MFLVLLVIGFAFGFVGSIPIAGPIALLVFAFGMEGRFRQALLVSAGSAIAEGAYAYLAFWGLRHLLDAYPFVVPYSSAGGAVVLVVLGVYFVRRRTAERKPDPEKKTVGQKRSFFLGLTITALNPTLIVTWTAAATALFSSGVLPRASAGDPAPFAIGAATGIVAWFATLLGLLHRYRTRFRHATVERVVRAIGVLLVGLSLWFGWRFVSYLLHRG